MYTNVKEQSPVLGSQTNKIIVILVTFMMLLGFLAPSAVSVSASVSATETMKSIQELSEAEIAEQLEYIYTKASTVDGDGNITSLDYNAIETTFGVIPEKESIEIKKVLPDMYYEGAWLTCMKNNLLDWLGITTLTALISTGLIKYIEKKSWQEAAKLMLKFVGVKSTVVGLVATLTYYSVKCAL